MEMQELEKIKEAFRKFGASAAEMARSANQFYAGLRSGGSKKQPEPEPQSKLDAYLESKKNRQPFYKSVGQTKPWE